MRTISPAVTGKEFFSETFFDESAEEAFSVGPLYEDEASLLSDLRLELSGLDEVTAEEYEAAARADFITSYQGDLYRWMDGDTMRLVGIESTTLYGDDF